MTQPQPRTENGAPASSGGRSSRMRWIIAILAVVCIVVVARFVPLKEYVRNLLTWADGLGVWGPVVVAAVYVPACVLFLPGSILTLGAGALFGVVRGTIAVSIGSTLGATVAFILGRTVARGLIEKKVAASPSFAAVDAAVGREGFKIVLLTRLSPVFPFNLLNYGYGLTKVRLRDYFLASWIGMLPGTIMYVYIGSAIGSVAQVVAGGERVRTPGEWAMYGFGLVATVIVTIYVTRVARRALKQEVPTVAEKSEEPKASPQHPQSQKGNRTMAKPVRVEPMDDYNEALVSHVHPTDWVNPKPAERYNLVVIGGGTAGLVTAAGAAGLGAKVALVENRLMGGDCLNVGCVPSKCLIRASRSAAEVRRFSEFGGRLNGGFDIDFPAAMERMRQLRSKISEHDSASRFRELGVDVFLGQGRFRDDHTVEVDGAILRYKKAVIATGARAVTPDVEGIDAVEFLTNENVFELTELPQRLAVFGAGPLGCEMAQTFRRFGSEVTIIEKNEHLLMREDRDAATIIARSFERDGIVVKVNTQVSRVEKTPDAKRLHMVVDGREETLDVDAVLIGAGRAPNVQGLNLEAVGVEYDDRRGVKVDDAMRTTNRDIYACGDICQREKFTHTADAAARIVIQNALFPGNKKYSRLVIPWCTYTDPEIAHVGMYERDAEERGLGVTTYALPFEEVDRAVADGAEEGLIKVHVKKGTDRILGATIVAEHAGEMVNEITLAMVAGVGLGKLSSVIHPYPTQAEAIRKVADAYNRTRLTPFVRSLFEKFLAWRR